MNIAASVFGLHVIYSRAYHSREEGLEAINRTEKELYDKMSEYCEDLKWNNSGSTIVLECTLEEDSGRFKCIFIYYGTSVIGFQYCHPVLGLDSTYLK